ncbi:MAG: hypothetical protein ACJ8ED_02485 [Xanthobacteraceae bacterium]
MRRYRSRPITERADQPDANTTDDRHPGRVHDLTVFDRGKVWQPLGILDANGEMIDRYVGLSPVGFLWDRFKQDD